MKWFRGGKASDYGGGRDTAGIVSWVTKKSGPPSTQLDGADAVAAFVEGKTGAVIGAFKAREGDAYEKFLAAANDGSLDDFQFADYAGADTDSVTLHTAHAEPATVDGEIAAFVLDNGYPLVDVLPEAWSRYQKKGLPLAILFTDPASESDDAVNAIKAAAEKVKGKFSFSLADGVRFKQQIERMGGSEELPSLAAMKLSGKANYPYDGELTADAVADWAQGIVDGAIKANLRSEEIPEDNTGGVFVAVGKNFDELIGGDKDVLLEIYAPWCGHCKSLAPIYEELGEKYASNDKVVIAKLDGTANDLEGVEYRGFPTLKFFPAGKGLAGMKDYDGGRTLDDFVTYLSENAVNAKDTGSDDKTEL